MVARTLPPELADLPERELRRALEARACRASLATFIKRGWRALPQHYAIPLVWTELQDAVARHVAAWWTGDIQRLLIAQPPGTAKSMVASVFGFAWIWTRDPTMRAICLSANPRVALEGANRCHELIASQWYQETFQPEWSFSRSQDTKGHFENTAGGSRWSQAMGSGLTGMRAPRILADDLLDAKDAHNDKAKLTQASEWYLNVASTRLTLGVPGGECLIGQRLHEADPIGVMLGMEAAGGPQWDYLCIPAEFDGQAGKPTSLGWSDWRTQVGEVACPQLLTPAVRAKARADLTELGYECQYNQKAAPAGGTMVRREWLRFWGQEGVGCPGALPAEYARWQDKDAKQWEALVISIDGTWKKTSDADYAVVQVWGYIEAPIGEEHGRRVFLDQSRKRCNPMEVVRIALGLEALWGPCARYRNVLTIVEAKASGPNVAELLRLNLPQVQDWDVQGQSKEERLFAVLNDFEAGLVTLPSPTLTKWVRDEYLPELLAFPQARHDDQVDATSQALLYIRTLDVAPPTLYSLGRETRPASNVVPLRR